MIENKSEENRQIEQPNPYFTAQAKRAQVREYQAGGESMIAYGDKPHLALSTFKIGATKYGEEKIPSALVPIVMAPKNTLTEKNQSTSLHRVEIPVGAINLIFPEMSSVNTLIQLIKG